MKTIIARSAGTLAVLSTLALATPAYAFSLSSFFNLFGGSSQTGAAKNSVVCTQEARLCPDGTSVSRTGPRCEFAPCPGEATTTRERDTDRDTASSTAEHAANVARGKVMAQCIRSAEQARNVAIRNAQTVFQAAQKNKSGAATSSQSVSARTTYKAAVKAAQDSFATARKACIGAKLNTRSATTTQQQ